MVVVGTGGGSGPVGNGPPGYVGFGTGYVGKIGNPGGGQTGGGGGGGGVPVGVGLGVPLALSKNLLKAR